MRTAVAMLLAAVLATIAETAAVAQTKIIAGYGGRSCGSWTGTRQAMRSPNREWKNLVDSVAVETWVIGYLCGKNVQRIGPDIFKGVDVEAILAWIDNYCQSYPLTKIADAADRLDEKLSRMHPTGKAGGQ
jgi:hypothetical protein